MDRIVYGIPFTSIIDQTAAIFREVLGNDVVLEHHSGIGGERQYRKRDEQERERDAAEKMTLAMEDWAAPIVVTINVQLFESQFANRPSRCRKLHNLVNAVIIIDEAQTIPRKSAQFTEPSLPARERGSKRQKERSLISARTKESPQSRQGAWCEARRLDRG